MITNEQIETLKIVSRDWFHISKDQPVAVALRAAIATLERMPTYADTGARFVPDHDECWIVVGGDDDSPFFWQCWPRFRDGKWEPEDDWAKDFWTGKFYSSEQAAIAAQRKDGE